MLLNQTGFKKFLSLLLIWVILLSQVACSSTPPTPVLSDPNPHIVMENIETETIILENILTEFIIRETYLNEITEAEKKISELLLEEETINQVISCITGYVPQDNIEEFAENIRLTKLFGDDVDMLPLLTKVAVGTGVIVTFTVLKKAGLSNPIASVVVAAADKSLEFGKTDAAHGSLFAGLIGATDEIDKSGRTSAVIGFAAATAGMILSIVSLIASVPSGGSTTITVAAGIELVIAAVSVLTATAETVRTGYQAIKTFTSTDAYDIDWSNIEWERVGVSSAKEAIENAADSYMWGAIIGTVQGGAEGYNFYQR